MIKHPVTGKSIVRDGLVLQHNYNLSSVELLSSGAASFNGSSDYINIDEGFAATNRTFTAWFNSSQNAITGTYGNTILSQTTSGGDNRWHIRIDPADNEVKVYNGATLEVQHDSTGITIVEGQWYHVAVTDNSSSVAFYINGILQKSDSFITGNDATDVFTIGQEFDGTSPSDFFKGYVCNVGIWDAVLTQAQVKSIMNKNYDSLSASEKEDLVSWWNLDSVIPDTTTLVYDNHHGGGEVLGSELATYTGGDINAGSYAGIQNSITPNLISGGTYRVSFTVSNYVSGSFRFRQAAGLDFGVTGAGNDDYVQVGTSTSTGSVNLDAFNLGFEGTISNISVKLINGNTGTLS